MKSVSPGAEKVIDRYFPVLDYGFVSLVDYFGNDESIVEAARVSYGAGTKKASESKNLLRYMKNHGHTSPFEMVELKFHISAPIFVLRQFLRHRTANLNEASGRYSILPTLFYTPNYSRMEKQSQTNKQGSSEELISREKFKEFNEQWQQLRSSNVDLYHNMLAEDLTRELARIDLPLSLYTQLYWKIDLHNFMHLLGLRLDSHAQWEIREYARVMAGILQHVCPQAFSAFIDYHFCARKLSRLDLLGLQSVIAGNSDDEVNIFLSSIGMSKREAEEFWGKIRPVEMPDLFLDPNLGRDGEFFKGIYEGAL